MQVSEKAALRLAVRAYDDYQKMRLSMGNRMKIKKDGTEQKIPESQEGYMLTARDKEMFQALYDNAIAQEKIIEKHIKHQLKSFPIYTAFLEGVKGCGPMSSARIISEFDIHQADTVSKLWQFAGLNPGNVYGKKVVKSHELNGHAIVKEYQNKQGETCYIVWTEDLVRGDKLTKGYVAPFNQSLRTALCGPLADAIIKAQGAYAKNYYYPYKKRLQHEEGWKDTTDGHRNQAAKRYMIKMFLKDLYSVWRPIEGLPTRPTYQEEYLGHTHKG